MTRLRPALIVAAALLSSPRPAPAAPTIEYGRDVKPVLARYCVSCHGPDKQRGGLRLDTAAGALKGGDGGPAVVPGKAAGSRLIQALAGTDDLPRMPPKDPRPTATEVAALRAWIDQGATAPAGETTAAATGPHWSFRPVTRPVPPAVRDAAWVRTPIDAFVLDRLEREGLKPSPEADRYTLVRRVYLDLIGLPPTPQEVDAFVSDESPDAYEKVVDRLLASPHYGERQARHWLDLARYADSNGYSIDGPRTMWPYRDWVINALNRDLPFDRFTIEQLAGDLLPNATADQKIATGFHRNTQVNQEGGVDPEQFRVEAVVDRTNTTGAVWLGLTVGCAQCHTHKYDPISHTEYYQLFAFLNAQEDVSHNLDGPKGKGAPAATALTLKEMTLPRPTRVLAGGDFTRPTTLVAPNTPAVLPPLRKGPERLIPSRLDLARWLVSAENPLTPRVTVNRVWGQYFGVALVETENDFGTQGERPSHPELLDWLADEFRSPAGHGWSLKKLHRLIVTSAAYRQRSAARPGLTADQRNRLLTRQARLRLEAEVVRDVCLAASGLLDRRVGGPSVFPPQPAVGRLTQVSRPWRPSEGPDRYRRGMYTHFWRAAPHPALLAFDAPDAGTTCTRRNRSNTPLQALTLLNDAGFYEYAHGLAGRVLAEAGPTPADRVRHAFRLCLGRHPTPSEAGRLEALFARQKAQFAADPKAYDRLFAGGGPAGRTLRAAVGPPEEKAALVMVARALLNLDEFITRE